MGTPPLGTSPCHVWGCWHSPDGCQGTAGSVPHGAAATGTLVPVLVPGTRPPVSHPREVTEAVAPVTRP